MTGRLWLQQSPWTVNFAARKHVLDTDDDSNSTMPEPAAGQLLHACWHSGRQEAFLNVRMCAGFDDGLDLRKEVWRKETIRLVENQMASANG